MHGVNFHGDTHFPSEVANALLLRLQQMTLESASPSVRVVLVGSDAGQHAALHPRPEVDQVRWGH